MCFSFDVVIRVAPSLECAIFFQFLAQFLLFFVITRAPIELFRIYVNYPTDDGAADGEMLMLPDCGCCVKLRLLPLLGLAVETRECQGVCVTPKKANGEKENDERGKVPQQTVADKQRSLHELGSGKAGHGEPPRL